MGRIEETKYIALMDNDFSWTERKLIKFRKLWNEDKPFHEICNELKRSQIDVAILIMDQAQKRVYKEKRNRTRSKRFYILILRQAVIKEKALKRRRRKLIKKLISHKYLKHRDGRQLYELTNKELFILVREHEVRSNT